MYKFFLNILRRNYWELTDEELFNLGVEYKLISEKQKENIAYHTDVAESPYEDWLSPYRKEIIQGLIEKDKYANSIIAVIISFIALSISLIAPFL